MKTRKACVAGQFYAGTRSELEREIEWCYAHGLGPGAIPAVNEKGPRKIIAGIAPHAGYVYSGPVAAHLYRELASDGSFETAVIVGPNHTGYGSGIAAMREGEWETPLGRTSVAGELADKILREKTISADEQAHRYEHSIEVQLPWLQHLYGEKLKIVPIAMMMQDLETGSKVGQAISESVGEGDVVIATTDFTHYESQAAALSKDKAAIEAILELDEEKLFQRVRELRISMCGYGPTIAAIVAAKRLGAKEATLLKYTTSGDITGDMSQVVGYAAIVMKR